MPKLIALLLLLTLPFAAHAAQQVQTLTNPNVSDPVWYLTDPSTNLISAQLTFDGGISLDPEGKEGLVNLLGGLMLSGADDLNAEKLAETLKDHAISISIDSRRDETILSLSAPARYWDEAVKLVADITAKPLFDQGEIDRAIAAQTASIKSDLSDPDWRAMRLMNGIVFENSVYARPGAGSATSVNHLKRNDFIQVYKRIFGSKPVHAVFVGKAGQDEINQMMAAFAPLPKAAESAPFDYRNFKAAKRYHQNFDVPQTSLYYILPGLHADDSDYAALTILNAVLSDGFGSRLMKALREESGLSYGVSGGISDSPGGALWAFSVRVDSGKLDEAAAILEREVAETATTLLPQKDIEEAAKVLAAQLPMGWTSSSAIAAQLAEAQRDGYSPDYLNEWQKRLLAVKAEDVQKLATRLLQDKQSVMIAVGRARPDDSWIERADLPNMD